jgi:hypothetical protein
MKHQAASSNTQRNFRETSNSKQLKDNSKGVGVDWSLEHFGASLVLGTWLLELFFRSSKGVGVV